MVFSSIKQKPQAPSKEPLSPTVLCGNFEISYCLKTKFGRSRNMDPHCSSKVKLSISSTQQLQCSSILSAFVKLKGAGSRSVKKIFRNNDFAVFLIGHITVISTIFLKMKVLF